VGNGPLSFPGWIQSAYFRKIHGREFLENPYKENPVNFKYGSILYIFGTELKPFPKKRRQLKVKVIEKEPYSCNSIKV